MTGATAGSAPRRGDRLAAFLVEGAGLMLAVPIWLWWAVWKGGYPAAVFMPGIVYLAAAAAVLHAFAPRPRLAGPPAWALAALAALAVWTLASLLWADDRGAGEIAAARQILLLASFALPLLWPPGRRALTAGLALWPAIVLAGGVAALVAVLGDASLLLDGRLVEPTGYVNATAALLATGILPALVLASWRELPPPLRVAMLTVAGPLLGLFVLTQSRGGAGALLLALLLVLALMPGRLRLPIPTALAALALLAALDPLLEVRAVAVEGGDVKAALTAAAWGLAALTAGLALLASLYVLIDGRFEVGPVAARRASAATGLGLAFLAAVAVIALALSGPDLRGWATERVEDFKTPDYSRLESERTRFTGELGSNRYDYWRVSGEVFAERPLLGAGAGNFIAPFLERRRADKATIYAHSLWLGTLAQLGIVGFLALAAFLAALAMALVRAARRPDTPRWLIVAAATPLLYVLLHASVDWVDAFPVVFAPPLALAAGAARLNGGQAEPAGRGVRSVSPWLTGGLVLAALICLPLAVSARLADRGATTWEERPAAAIDDLERAAELDPLAAAPYVRLGIVALELGRPALQRRALAAALERDPSAWYPRFQLGLLDAAQGRRRAAIRRLEAAAARNPREPELGRALRAVRAGKSFDARAAQVRILRRSED